MFVVLGARVEHPNKSQAHCLLSAFFWFVDE